MASDFKSEAFDAGNARITKSEPVGNEVRLAAIMWRILRATLCRTTEFPTLLLRINPNELLRQSLRDGGIQQGC